MSGQIEIVKFGPTEDQLEFRKALAHRVLPEVVRKMDLSVDLALVGDTAKFAAHLTLAFCDAMIEELDE